MNYLLFTTSFDFEFGKLAYRFTGVNSHINTTHIKTYVHYIFTTFTCFLKRK